MTPLTELSNAIAFIKWKERIVIGKLLCLIGLHKRDNDFVLHWSSKRWYCKCERCGERIYQRGR